MALLGDFFQNLGELFQSSKRREQEKARVRRQAFRRAEMAVDDVNRELKSFDKRAREAWTNARELMKSGERAAGQRALVEYRGTQVLIAKYDQKRFAFEQSILGLKMAETDGRFADSLRVLGAIVEIAPEKVDDVLATVDVLRQEQGEVDRLWQKEYQRHMDGFEGVRDDYVPSMEELAQQLEDEVAEEIGTPEHGVMKAEMAVQIEEARSRIRKLLDEEKSP